MTTVLILGSAPAVIGARDWPRAPFDRVVAINNAHAVRPDWDDLVHPWDFPADRLPETLAPTQRLVTETSFVPAQNAFGGFIYAGATMAFTAAYWALFEYRPRTIAYFGCDMTYPARGRTHFYGRGSPDPLRADITLRSLEGKSARLRILAARAGCAVVNLSQDRSRLALPRARPADLPSPPAPYDRCMALRALGLERALGYDTPTGRYWEEIERFDPAALACLDALWLAANGAAAEAA